MTKKKSKSMAELTSADLLEILFDEEYGFMGECSVKLDKKLLKKLIIIAYCENRSVVELIHLTLEKSIAKYEDKFGPIKGLHTEVA
jgi:hypothetical protein